MKMYDSEIPASIISIVSKILIYKISDTEEGSETKKIFILYYYIHHKYYI